MNVISKRLFVYDCVYICLSWDCAGSSLEVKIETDSNDAMEIKTEADSNITDKPSTGMFVIYHTRMQCGTVFSYVCLTVYVSVFLCVSVCVSVSLCI